MNKVKVISMLVAALALGLMLGTAASAVAEDVIVAPPAAVVAEDAVVAPPAADVVCPQGGVCDGTGNPTGECPNPEAGANCDGTQQRLRDGSGAGQGRGAGNGCGNGNGACATTL